MDERELREYFAGRLPDRAADLERAHGEARDAGWTGPPLRTFHRLAHSLAGAGTTFGFPEVTAIARRVEALLAAAMAEESIPEEARREIGLLLGRLREIAR